MTINEAIAQVNRTRQNRIPDDVMITWLSRLDHQIYEEVIRTREGWESVSFTPYGADDGEKTLLVPPPYDEMYIYKLEASIYYEQREINKYATSMTMFNAVMEQYMKKYNRDHRALALPAARFW